MNLHSGMAQAWVPAPPKPKREGPFILLFSMPGDQTFSVATMAEAVAVNEGKGQSFLGDLLRPHAALMSLPYLCNN